MDWPFGGFDGIGGHLTERFVGSQKAVVSGYFGSRHGFGPVTGTKDTTVRRQFEEITQVDIHNDAFVQEVDVFRQRSLETDVVILLLDQIIRQGLIFLIHIFNLLIQSIDIKN